MAAQQPGGSSSMMHVARSSSVVAPANYHIQNVVNIPQAPRAGGDMMIAREYRKGNWMLHETLVLIAAKKMDDERRQRGGEKDRNRTAELRWKWIENYCWRKGCHRNQNQCNDKWDNLLRDYKKVRDYEAWLLQQQAQAEGAAGASFHAAGPPAASYWALEKHERKEKGLPSNLLFQVYEALHEIVDKRYPPRLPPPPAQLASLPVVAVAATITAPSGAAQQCESQHSPAPAELHYSHHREPCMDVQKPLLGPSSSIQQLQHLQDKFTMAAPSTMQQLAGHQYPGAQQSNAPTTGTKHERSSERSDEEASGSEQGSEMPQSISPAKRRRVASSSPAKDEFSRAAAAENFYECLSATGAALGSAVARSTGEISQILLACEDRKDRRHKDLLELEERKLHMERMNAEISREGIAGLITAINNLSSAIMRLASDKA